MADREASGRGGQKYRRYRVIQEIDVPTLQEWLAQGRPVKVLDVRPAQDRDVWWISGSEHVDACESLKNGAAGPLADVSVPADEVVVTVCGIGRASTKAAGLARRGRQSPTWDPSLVRRRH
jgi:rhodanese-related sulfurtransferase